ncbi:MAG: prephenate dehydrogenase dimerization domain-containing protein, partial [Paraglaciecola sp.]
HDDAMVFIQVMRHFCSFVFGSHLAGENPDLQKLISLSSPIYRLELAMVGRLFAQAPALYADIIFDNKDSVAMLTEFSLKFNQALALVENSDKEKFIQQFTKVSSWFGDYAKQSLIDSKQFLLKADDGRTLIENC